MRMILGRNRMLYHSSASLDLICEEEAENKTISKLISISMYKLRPD